MLLDKCDIFHLQHRTAWKVLLFKRRYWGYELETDSMDSAKSTLRSIVLATEHIRNTTTQYSTTRRIRNVRQHSLIRLESDFQAIIDASRAILAVFDNPLLRRHYMLDDRLVDWLSGPEPEMCLDALRGMEGLLNIDHEVQAFSGFTPTRSGCQEDNIHRAIVLFHTHNVHFHFLLTTNIWWVRSLWMNSCLTALDRNYENEVLRPTIPSKAE